MTKELRLLKQTLKSQPNVDRLDSSRSPSARTTLSQDIPVQNVQLPQVSNGHHSEAPFQLADEDASTQSFSNAELGGCSFDKVEVLELFRL